MTGDIRKSPAGREGWGQTRNIRAFRSSMSCACSARRSSAPLRTPRPASSFSASAAPFSSTSAVFSSRADRMRASSAFFASTAAVVRFSDSSVSADSFRRAASRSCGGGLRVVRAQRRAARGQWWAGLRGRVGRPRKAGLRAG